MGSNERKRSLISSCRVLPGGPGRGSSTSPQPANSKAGTSTNRESIFLVMGKPEVSRTAILLRAKKPRTVSCPGLGALSCVEAAYFLCGGTSVQDPCATSAKE